MKDYSLNLEERKNFILGYNITKDGQIKVKFATGKSWYLPYDETNENKLLKKMEEQVAQRQDNQNGIVEGIKLKTCAFIAFLANLSVFYMISTGIEQSLLFSYCFSLLETTAMIVLSISSIRDFVLLKDLERNIKFLEMKDKLNKVVKTDENTLVDVSTKTKNVIQEFSEEKEIFNINSFNYVSFKDLEQIMENAARNEKFGFNYEKEEETKNLTRKRVK